MTDNFMDRMEDEMENMPEGEHDDQVDAVPFPEVKPPMRLRRWFNVMMLIVNVIGALVVLVLIPLIFGFGLFGLPVNVGYFIKYYILGLMATASVFLGMFYLILILDHTRKAIRHNIALIRKNFK